MRDYNNYSRLNIKLKGVKNLVKFGVKKVDLDLMECFESDYNVEYDVKGILELTYNQQLLYHFLDGKILSITDLGKVKEELEHWDLISHFHHKADIDGLYHSVVDLLGYSKYVDNVVYERFVSIDEKEPDLMELESIMTYGDDLGEHIYVLSSEYECESIGVTV